jgi:hypothetical protein
MGKKGVRKRCSSSFGPVTPTPPPHTHTLPLSGQYPQHQQPGAPGYYPPQAGAGGWGAAPQYQYPPAGFPQTQAAPTAGFGVAGQYPPSAAHHAQPAGGYGGAPPAAPSAGDAWAMAQVAQQQGYTAQPTHHHPQPAVGGGGGVAYPPPQPTAQPQPVQNPILQAPAPIHPPLVHQQVRGPVGPRGGGCVEGSGPRELRVTCVRLGVRLTPSQLGCTPPHHLPELGPRRLREDCQRVEPAA